MMMTIMLVIMTVTFLDRLCVQVRKERTYDFFVNGALVLSSNKPVYNTLGGTVAESSWELRVIVTTVPVRLVYPGRFDHCSEALRPTLV
jgi:hypothetical protein